MSKCTLRAEQQRFGTQNAHTATHTHKRVHTHTNRLGEASFLAEELDEAALAVGLVILLFEGALVELLEAEGKDKVLRVELLGHCCDAAACDGLLAARAEGPAALMVVALAVGLALVLKEAPIYKGGEALL